jgi:CheY-like chemotaxis protein
MTEILLADDNLINQKLILNFFHDSDYNIDVADNGIIAFEMIKKKKYDIIFMDFMMPEMDGYKATIEIRNLGITTPIVGFSAYDDKEEIGKFLKAGMNDYLLKPVSKNAIISLVNKYMNKDFLTIEQKSGGDKFYFMNKMTVPMKIEFINDFLDYIGVQIDLINKLISEKKYAELESAAHKFKGSFFSLGSDRLNSILKTVEQNANEKNDGNFPVLMDDLKCEIRTISAEINEYLKKIEIG